jgi:hypothetical protein
VPVRGLSTKPTQDPQTPYTKGMNSEQLKVLNFSMTLQDRCLGLASAMAADVNGDLDCVPQEDIDALLAGLTLDNLEETAEELAHLAHWFN